MRRVRGAVLEFDAGGVVRPARATSTQVLDEIRDTGYAGTELGDWGFMPTDPAGLQPSSRQAQLQLVGAFVPVALADRSRARSRACRRPLATARLMRDAGARGRIHRPVRRQRLRSPEREQHAGRIRARTRACRTKPGPISPPAPIGSRTRCGEETGLRTVFHPHCGGYVETPDEIDELMRAHRSVAARSRASTPATSCMAAAIRWTVLERHADASGTCTSRTAIRVAKRGARAGLGYLAAVRAQLFCELGTGTVDFRGGHARPDAARRTTAGSSSNRMCSRATARRRERERSRVLHSTRPETSASSSEARVTHS